MGLHGLEQGYLYLFYLYCLISTYPDRGVQLMGGGGVDPTIGATDALDHGTFSSTSIFVM
jgi:hypothetical protein